MWRQERSMWNAPLDDQCDKAEYYKVEWQEQENDVGETSKKQKKTAINALIRFPWTKET